MYPFHALIAIPVETKGQFDDYAVDRLASFIRSTGVKDLVYMSDQEGSLKSFFQTTFNLLASNGELVKAVPENSAVGESQSNGAAERPVQMLEDLVRTHKLSFEDRLGKPLPSTSPLLQWLVEHVAAVMNKSTL